MEPPDMEAADDTDVDDVALDDPAVYRQGGDPEELRAHAAPGGLRAPTPAVQQYVDGLDRRGGRSLPNATRRLMEPGFRRDFGDVRAHTDEEAARATEAVNARAFTVGRHVVFGTGQYAPETAPGRALLAHELTHVVQQSIHGTVAARSIQRARWGTCPPGESLPGNHPFRYTAAELGMVSYYRVAGGSSCWATNVEKFWEMSCAGDDGRMVKQFVDNFRSGRGTQNRRIGAGVGDVPAPTPGKSVLEGITAGDAAVRAVAALVQPDIIDFTNREIYDVTTAKQASRKVAKIRGYAGLASRITGKHWSPGTRLKAPPAPVLAFLYRPGEVICYGPTDLSARPGVLAYEVIGLKKKKKVTKDEKQKKDPKTAAPGGGNVGFVISILSTGGGSGNAGVGISIMSDGVAYGTVGAGVVYDSTGRAVGAAGAGAGIGNTSAGAGVAGVGAAKDSTSVAAGTAGPIPAPEVGLWGPAPLGRAAARTTSAPRQAPPTPAAAKATSRRRPGRPARAAARATWQPLRARPAERACRAKSGPRPGVSPAREATPDDPAGPPPADLVRPRRTGPARAASRAQPVGTRVRVRRPAPAVSVPARGRPGVPGVRRSNAVRVRMDWGFPAGLPPRRTESSSRPLRWTTCCGKHHPHNAPSSRR